MDTRRSQRGFTLIELVTALVIASTLAVMVVMQWPGDTINLAAQAEQLSSDIRYTQALAMHRNARYRVNFAADRYWISDQSGATAIPHPANNATQVMLAAGITLGATQSFLVFDEMGIPYTTATTPGAPLTADAVITLAVGGETRLVRVSPETGRVIAP